MSFKKTFMRLDKVNFTQTKNSLPLGYVLKKIESPSYEFYKQWHDNVGKQWNWHLRPRINDRKAITDLISNPNVEMWLFSNNNEYTGYALIDYTETEGPELSDFGFLPTYQGQGLGNLFLPEITKKAFEKDIDFIWLSTRDTNHSNVIGFYQKHGFRITKEEIVKV